MAQTNIRGIWNKGGFGTRAYKFTARGNPSNKGVLPVFSKLCLDKEYI
jgi:hypothetical protein